MKKVLIPTKLDSIARELLEANGYQVVQDSDTPMLDLVKSHPDCEALIVRSEKVTPEPEKDFLYVKAGNENGIFLLEEPGTGYDTALIAVVPNGAVVEILAGPVSINYSEWYQIQLQGGERGWTIGSSLVPINAPK